MGRRRLIRLSDTESERDDDEGVGQEGEIFGGKTSVVTRTSTVRYDTSGAAGRSFERTSGD